MTSSSEEEIVEFPCANRRDGSPCMFEENENGEMECMFCGRIGSNVAFRGHERVFDAEDEKKLCSDQGAVRGIEETVIGGVYKTNPSGLSQGYSGRDRTLVFTTKRKTKDKRVQKWLHDLGDLCSKMGLGGKTTRDCEDILVSYVRRAKSLPKRKEIPIILGVLFYGRRMNDEQCTILELARQTKTDKSMVLEGLKLIGKNCSGSMVKSTIDPTSLITRYCYGMNPLIRNSFLAKAQVVAEHLNPYLEGKKPNTVAATDMVLTHRWFFQEEPDWNEEELTKRIADITKVKLKTLKSSISLAESEMEKYKKTVSEIVADAEYLDED